MGEVICPMKWISWLGHTLTQLMLFQLAMFVYPKLRPLKGLTCLVHLSEGLIQVCTEGNSSVNINYSYGQAFSCSAANLWEACSSRKCGEKEVFQCPG